MLKRTLTGIIGIFFLILFIYILPKIYFFFLVFFVILFSLFEFFNLFEKKRISLKFIISSIIAIFFLFSFINKNYFEILTYLIVIFLLSFSLTIVFFENIYEKTKDILIFVTANIYITIFLNFSILIFNHSNGKNLLMLLLVIAWATDTFAYIIGTKFGRTKLYQKLSPNKTIEGVIGGLLGGIIAGYIFNFFLTKIPIIKFSIISFLTVIFCILGDLFESLIKRINNVKDSGRILPGHGGILDRIDSLFFAIPVFYIILQILK